MANLNKDDANSFLLRVGHRLTSKHDLMSRYASRIENLFAHFHSVGAHGHSSALQNIVLGLTSTLPPNLLERSPLQLDGQLIASRARTPGIRSRQISAFLRSSRPKYRWLSRGIGIGANRIAIGEGQPWYLTVNSFQWYDGITWMRALHQGWSRHPPGAFDAYLGTRQTTVTRLMASSLGDGFADFLLGIPSASSLALQTERPCRFRRTQ
jgi:hypothetical protein